jgi:hypothetical protein
MCGVLGLPDRDEIVDDDHDKHVGVDSSKPLPTVLRDATRYGLRQDEDMRLLHDIDRYSWLDSKRALYVVGRFTTVTRVSRGVDCIGREDTEDASCVSWGKSCEDVDGTTLDGISKGLRSYYAFGRGFFFAKDGRMGLAPSGLRANDVVAILRGALMSCVLGKEIDGYTFLGPVYVHGVVHGEAVEEWNARSEPETVFPIR